RIVRCCAIKPEPAKYGDDKRDKVVEQEKRSPHREGEQEHNQPLQNEGAKQRQERARDKKIADSENQQTHPVRFQPAKLRPAHLAPGEARNEPREGKSVTEFGFLAAAHGKIGTSENHCDQWAAITSSSVWHQVCIARSMIASRSRSTR